MGISRLQTVDCSGMLESFRSKEDTNQRRQNFRNYILLDPTASVLVLVDNHDTLYPFTLTEMAPLEVVGTVHLKGSARNWGKVGVYACQSFSCSITYGT